MARAAGLGEAELADALRAAVTEEVLVPSARGDAFAFRHALLREAAYAGVLPGERARLHAALARDLEAHPELAGGAPRSRPSSPITGRPPGGARPPWPRACARGGRPSGSMRIRGPAPLPARARAGDGGRGRRRPRADHGRRRRRRERAGQHAEAIALARRAIELVDAQAEPLRAGLLHARLARFLQDAGRGAEARELSAHAVALIPREPTRERALVLEAHARLLLLSGRVGAARPAVEEAIAIARSLGARDVEAAALTTRIITLQGDVDAAAAAGGRRWTPRAPPASPRRCCAPTSTRRRRWTRPAGCRTRSTSRRRASRRRAGSARSAGSGDCAPTSPIAWSSSAASTRRPAWSPTRCAGRPPASRRRRCTRPRR